MKKFYTFVMASALAFAANAQQIQKSMDRPVYTFDPATMTVAPQKAQSLQDGAISWGWSPLADLNSSDISCVGYGQAGTYYVGVQVPANELLTGAEIVAVDVPLYSATVMTGDYTVYVLDGTTILAQKTVELSSLVDFELNTITLDTPVKVEKDLIVCAKYTTSGTSQAACYPVLFDKNTLVKGSLLLGSSTGTFEFTEYGDYFGASLTKVQLTGITMSDANVTASAEEGYTAADSDDKLEIFLESNSGKAVSEIEYTLKVGDAEAQTFTKKISMNAGFNQSASFTVSFHTPATVGDYNIVLNVTKVNGAENAGSKDVTIPMHNLSRMADRNVVMEEFTGTGCGYCPRGWAGMLECNEKYGDRFIGIALHQYNSSDPMYIAPASYPLSYGGAPSSYIDRAGGEVDPGFSSASAAIEKRFKVVAPVAVDVKATWADEDKKSVNVTGIVDAIASGTYELVFVLTADGLTGTSFKQSNYYYQYSKSNDGSILDEFCNGGKYGKSSVQLVYDDVALATSYASSKNKGGKLTLGTDEKGSADYTLSMPTKTALLTAIKNADYDVYAVVIALKGDGTIANAGKVKVTSADESSISGVVADTTAPVAYYSLDGRRLDAPVHGVNIIRMSDGTSKKVVLD